MIQKANKKYLGLDNVVFALWILNLFKPDWILAYYVPGLEFVRTIPTVILYPAFIYLLISGRKIVLDKPYLIYLFASLATAIFAYNTGISRQVFRYVAESMVLYILTISVVEDERSIDRLFTLYVLSFAFYGIWGIMSGGRVPFHVNMNNEDAFGPFMAMGVPMAFFFAHRMGIISYRSISVFVICVIGVVASFARGAFLSLCSGIVYIWYLYPRKIAAFFSVVIVFMVILASSSIIFKESSYWDEMSTIIDAHKADVGDLGRQYLWTSAVKMFLAHPIEGVGPRNYGTVLPRFTTPEQIEPRGIRYSEIYGRVPHNIYMQILAEMGIIGSVAFLLLVTIFFKRNRITCRAYEVLNKRSRFGHFEQKPDGTDDIRKYYYLAIAIQGAFIIYLVNGLFYDLLYFHWFSDLLILNSLVYQASRKRALNMADVHARICN